jgi:hypothetical protein
VTQDLRAEEPSEMEASLAPIEAEAAEPPPRAWRYSDIDAKGQEKTSPFIRQRWRFGTDNETAGAEVRQHTHGQVAGEMVVTDSGGSQPGVARARVEMAAASRREAHQPFEDLCDLRSRQSEISMSPLLFQGQDFRFVKLPKMTACRCTALSSLECEVRRGESTAVHLGKLQMGAIRL